MRLIWQYLAITSEMLITNLDTAPLNCQLNVAMGLLSLTMSYVNDSNKQEQNILKRPTLKASETDLPHQSKLFLFSLL